MSGGAGYVLSREALRRFVQGFRSGRCTHSSPVEDMALGRCMETMKVKAGDSRDEKERETFNPFDPASHLVPPDNGKQFWGYSYYPTKRVSVLWSSDLTVIQQNTLTLLTYNRAVCVHLQATLLETLTLFVYYKCVQL